jgi:AcrR family transcriptional regulator
MRQSPLPRRERKKQVTRRRVLDVARGLFQTQGYYSTTVEQIAEAADVAVATVFNYFPSKESILSGLGAAVFDDVVAAAARPLEPAESARERLAEVFSVAAGAFARAHASLGDLLLRVGRAALSPHTGDEPLARLRWPLSRLILDGQKRGELRSDLDAAFAAELLVGVFGAALLSWLGDPRYPVAARMDEAAAFADAALARTNP